MNLVEILVTQFVFTSSNITNKDANDPTLKSNYSCNSFARKYRETLSEIFDKFKITPVDKYFKFTNSIFKRFIDIIHLYPCVNEENYIIPFLGDLKSGKSIHRIAIKVYGHDYPNYTTLNLSKRNYMHLKKGLSMARIIDLKNSMLHFQKYEYCRIFKSLKNDNLLYHVVLTSFVENMGITYLRLLSEIPYYKEDKFFIRDFIVQSSSFLHSVNIIYKGGLNDYRVMNVFKVFVSKNLKLLCIFYNAWILSYDFIIKRVNNSNFSHSSPHQPLK